MHGIAFLGDELMKVSTDSGRWDNAAAVTEPLATLRQSWEAAVQKATSSPGDQNLHVKYKVLVDEGDGGPSSLHGPSGKTPPSQQTPPGVAPWWPDDGPEWTALTNGGSGNQSSEMQSLRAPLDAARMISDDWDRYDLGAIDWSHPPSDLPPELLNAIQFVEQNPALLKAMSGGGSDPVTQKSLNTFIGNAQHDLSQAVEHYQTWQKANPNAGPMAIQLAQSAAILEANNTLLGGTYSAQDLENFASQNPGLSSSLTGAAKMWAEPGMLHFLDTAGTDPRTTDGLVNGGNIGAWLTKGLAPGTDNETMDFINAAASRGPTAGVDTSKLNADIFVHPENYTGEQKAAALQQLLDTRRRLAFDADPNVQALDSGTQGNDGVNPNMDKTNADLQSKIDILQNDADVRSFLNSKTGAYLQSIVNSDPDMKAAINASYERFKTGATLNDDLNAKDSNGNQIVQPAALHLFISQAGFFQLAIGQDGKLGSPLDLTAIAKKSGSYQHILDYYNSNVVTANDLKTLMGEGNAGAAKAFGLEIQDYGAVIDPSDGAPQTRTLQDNLNSTALSGLTPQQLETALGDGHENLDQTKLDALINQLDQQATANGTPLSTSDKAQIVSIVHSVWNAVTFGTQTSDAVKDLNLGKWNNPLAKAYNVGALHGASAILGGIALGLSIKGSAPSDPASIARFIGLGVQNLGFLINGAARVYNFTLDRLQQQLGEAFTERTAARAGVAKAKEDLDASGNELLNAKAEEQSAKSALEDAKKRVSEAEEALKAAQAAPATSSQRDVDAANEKVESARKEVATARTGVQSAEKAHDAAEGRVSTAENDVQSKKQALGDAENRRGEAVDKVGSIQRKIDVLTPGGTRLNGGDLVPNGGGTGSMSSKGSSSSRRGAAVGEGITGGGAIIAGAAGIAIGIHEKAAGETELGNLNIATGAVTLGTGVADFIEGGINAVGLGKLAMRGGGSLGDWAVLADGLIDTPLALAAAGLGIAEILLGLKKEKEQNVAETKVVDGILKQYEITGGTTLPSDRPGPLGKDGLPDPANTNAPGNAPPMGPSQTHSF
jgi:Type III secretion system translocator protein, HrpF